MTEQERRQLAEMMGRDVSKSYNDISGNVHHLFNPDINHRHFNILWEKLTDKEKHAVIFKFLTVYEFIDTLLGNLPEVLRAVLQVKGEG